MGRDLGPVREADIGEKALVAPQQDAADEPAGKEHGGVVSAVSYQLSAVSYASGQPGKPDNRR
jgi:hypothetical protein